jgi:hypothetical protein
MALDTDASFKIGLLGPSRVGKTSLVTALLAQTHKLLEGTSVAMHTVGRATEQKLVRNRADLEGDIFAGEFSSGKLESTKEPFIFKLGLDPGVPDSQINIDLLDFPGGWLDPDERPDQYSDDWEKCRAFITQSTILLIPVDAALLMEATDAGQRRAVSRLLTIVAVQEVARDWAKERNQRPAEPGLVAFCPVKCESYFNDNGGRTTKAKELSERFHKYYADVIDTVRNEAPGVTMLYAPVDTIGCVDLIDAEWPLDAHGNASFKASYRIREPRKISRVGADDVMRAVCRQLVEGRRALSAEQGEELSYRAAQARQYAERDEGFFRNVWIWLNGERGIREQNASARGREAADAVARVAALDTQLKRIAAQPDGKRVEQP